MKSNWEFREAKFGEQGDPLGQHARLFYKGNPFLGLYEDGSIYVYRSEEYMDNALDGAQSEGNSP